MKPAVLLFVLIKDDTKADKSPEANSFWQPSSLMVCHHHHDHILSYPFRPFADFLSRIEPPRTLVRADADYYRRSHQPTNHLNRNGIRPGIHSIHGISCYFSASSCTYVVGRRAKRRRGIVTRYLNDHQHRS